MDGAAKHSSIHMPLEDLTNDTHPCSYLPGRTARTEFGLSVKMETADYQRLMNAGFRRSGHIVYRPICDGCRECVPLRVPVGRFAPSRAQRRVIRRNSDVSVEVGRPECTDEKHRIYAEYLHHQHDEALSGRREELEAFLYQSPVETREMVYRVQGRIVAVGIVDVCPDCLSSVYFYFDPAESRRSLGVLGALCEIAQCVTWGLEFWYVGYYVKDCRRMNYKAQFRPFELLGADGVWRAACD